MQENEEEEEAISEDMVSNLSVSISQVRYQEGNVNRSNINQKSTILAPLDQSDF